MDAPPTERIRIVVIARPVPGRMVSDALAAAGYEVYRTPDASNLSALQQRIHPHLAIVALDLLGQDGLATALQLKAEARGAPVLLLGDGSERQGRSGHPCVSPTAGSVHLLAAVADALSAKRPDARLSAAS